MLGVVDLQVDILNPVSGSDAAIPGPTATSGQQEVKQEEMMEPGSSDGLIPVHPDITGLERLGMCL